MRKVAIIDIGRSGEPLRHTPEYRPLIDLLTYALAERQGLEISLLGDAQAAKEWLAGQGVAVFITWDAKDTAQRFARQAIGTRTVIWTGGAQEATLEGVTIVLRRPHARMEEVVREILGD